MKAIEENNNEVAKTGVADLCVFDCVHRTIYMGRIILMLLLVTISRSAMAEWVRVDRGHDYTAYADIGTIRKSGNKARMWILFDLDNAEMARNGKLRRSMRMVFESDCQEGQIRHLNEIDNSGNMGIGEAVESHPNGNWIFYAPGSINEALWKIACGTN